MSQTIFDLGCTFIEHAFVDVFHLFVNQVNAHTTNTVVDGILEQ